MALNGQGLIKEKRYWIAKNRSKLSFLFFTAKDKEKKLSFVTTNSHVFGLTGEQLSKKKINNYVTST